MKRGHWIVLAALLFLGWQAWQRRADVDANVDVGAASAAIPTSGPDPIGAEAAPTRTSPTNSYPREVAETLRLIQHGGPFPYDRDGVVFGNFEHRLPQRERGWYHEYTVPTPGARNRGARRIIAGGRPPSEFWYTGDHYESFTRLDAPTP
jgi:guanyl-specific ribonuclease Sa